jgi:protein TonB
MSTPHTATDAYVFRNTRLLTRLACFLFVLGLHGWLFVSLLETRAPTKLVKPALHTVAAMILTEAAAKPAHVVMPSPPVLDPKTDPIPDPKLDLKPEPNPDLKPDLKPDPNPDPNPEPKQAEQVLLEPPAPAAAPVHTVRPEHKPRVRSAVTQSPVNTTAIARTVTTSVDPAATVKVSESPKSLVISDESVTTPASTPAALIEPGLRCPLPTYPKMSRRQLEEGLVTLRFLVDADGHVLQTEIARTSGFSRLDVAASDALSKCQFKPAMLNGHATQSWTSIKYSWRLQ